MELFFAERFNRIIRYILKRPDFERRNADWIDILPIIPEQYKQPIQFSNKLTPTQVSLEKKEGFAYRLLAHKRKKVRPKI